MTTRTTFLTLTLAMPFAVAALLPGCQRGSDPQDQVAGDDPSAADSAGSSGDVKQPGTEENQPPVHAAHEAPAQPPVGQQSGSHVGEKTKEILDANEMIKDPNWTVIASDPQEVQGFSFAGTAYNRAAALAGTANLEKWIQLEQAQSESGSFPTYTALKEYIDTNPVDMPRLREYHHYGYDATTGNVVILENRAEKEGRRKELGLSPDE